MVVLLDFSSGGPGELSVRCGQTVELVERSAERPGWCLVRTTDQTPQQVTNRMSSNVMNCDKCDMGNVPRRNKSIFFIGNKSNVPKVSP